MIGVLLALVAIVGGIYAGILILRIAGALLVAVLAMPLAIVGGLLALVPRRRA